ncbi:hypothetical protein MRB53_038085 [Persea americana]|nr:hypothetical protein MRB53_038085 [Persea americana]
MPSLSSDDMGRQTQCGCRATAGSGSLFGPKPRGGARLLPACGATRASSAGCGFLRDCIVGFVVRSGYAFSASPRSNSAISPPSARSRAWGLSPPGSACESIHYDMKSSSRRERLLGAKRRHQIVTGRSPSPIRVESSIGRLCPTGCTYWATRAIPSPAALSPLPEIALHDAWGAITSTRAEVKERFASRGGLTLSHHWVGHARHHHHHHHHHHHPHRKFNFLNLTPRHTAIPSASGNRKKVETRWKPRRRQAPGGRCGCSANRFETSHPPRARPWTYGRPCCSPYTRFPRSTPATPRRPLLCSACLLLLLPHAYRGRPGVATSCADPVSAAATRCPRPPAWCAHIL